MDNFFRRVFHEDLPAFLSGGVVVGIPGVHFLFADPPYATEFWILVVKFFGLCGTVFVSGLLTVLSKDFYLYKVKHRIFKHKKDEDERAKKDAA
jgi:hypothetical protein